jgi:hypothetical protein
MIARKRNTELCEGVCAYGIVEQITRYKKRSKDHLEGVALRIQTV